MRNIDIVERRPQKLQRPGLVKPSVILEQIKSLSGLSKFAVHEEYADGSWRDNTTDEFPVDGAIYAPMKDPLWPLSGEPMEYGSEIELLDDVVEFWKYHHELRDPRCYEVAGCFILVTWRIERFKIVPYLCFLGPKGTGKTRGLEILQQLAFRGWLITHPTPAVVFWVVDRYYPTLLADNYEFWPKDTRHDLDGLFNAGYRRGMVVPRRPREGDQNDSGLIVYKTFSPKALAGTREPVDSLGSRCIFMRTSRNQQEKPVEIDLDWARKLRSKLLAYRFHHHERDAGNMTEIMNRYGRVGEIFLPVLEVAPTEQVRNHLIDFELGVYQDQREDEATSLEAQVIRAIVESTNLAVDGRLAVRNIVDAINADRSDKDNVRPERIGWITNRLGFKKTRLPDAKGTRAIQLESELLERLTCTYDVTPPQKPSDRQTDRKEGELDKFTDSSDSLTGKEEHGLPHPNPHPSTIEPVENQVSYSPSQPPGCQTVGSDATSELIQPEIAVRPQKTVDSSQNADAVNGYSERQPLLVTPTESNDQNAKNPSAIRRLRSLGAAPSLEHYVDFAETILGDADRARELVDQLTRDGELLQNPNGQWTWAREGR